MVMVAGGFDPLNQTDDIYRLMARPMDPLDRMRLMRLAASTGASGAPKIGAGYAGAGGAPAASAPMPVPQTPESEESPLVSGAKLAGQVNADKAAGAAPRDELPWNRNFLDTVKQYMATEGQPESSEQDKGMALAQAGFGVAASNSPYFGQALGQGALVGLQALQKAKAERAENALRFGSLENQRNYQEGMLSETARLRGIQEATEARLLTQYEGGAGLRNAQEEQARASAARDRADAARLAKITADGPPRPKIAYTPDGNSLGMVNANDPDIKAQAETGGILWDKPKTLTAGEQKSLGNLAERRSEFQGLQGTFKQDYAGNTFGGDIENWASRTLPWTSKDQGDWWQRYQQQQNIVRNELFGSALTAPEQKQWERAAINPNMDPKAIERNLTRQNVLLDRALARKYHSYKAGKYNTAQLDALTGAPTMSAEEANAPYKDEGDVGAGGAPSAEDIAHTAKVHGITEDEVRQRLGIK